VIEVLDPDRLILILLDIGATLNQSSVAGSVGDLSSDVEVVVLRHHLMILKR